MGLEALYFLGMSSIISLLVCQWFREEGGVRRGQHGVGEGKMWVEEGASVWPTLRAG